MKRLKKISSIALFFVALYLSGCYTLSKSASSKSERETVQNNIEFLLEGRIDTISSKVNELIIADSSIVKCLDTFIDITERLPQFDRRLLPELTICFGISPEDRSVFVIYERTENIYIDAEDTTLFEGDTVLLSHPRYGILNYRGYKIAVTDNADDSSLHSEKEIFFKPSGKFTTMDSYLFYSKKYNKYIHSWPMWENTIIYNIVKNKIVFSEMYYMKDLCTIH